MVTEPSVRIHLILSGGDRPTEVRRRQAKGYYICLEAFEEKTCHAVKRQHFLREIFFHHYPYLQALKSIFKFYPTRI